LRRFITFIAIVAGCLVAAPAAYADTGPSRTMIFGAERRAAGERVLVDLRATCPAGATIKVVVTVTAVNGDQIAQGTRQKKADCTGATQPVELRVEYDPAGALFRVGPATARTVRTVCDDTACETISFDETIRIS
jgi:hypothetical protein